MHWKLMAYVAACVLVPVIWGLIAYWLSSQIERSVLGKKGIDPDQPGDKKPTLPLDYYI